VHTRGKKTAGSSLRVKPTREIQIFEKPKKTGKEKKVDFLRWGPKRAQKKWKGFVEEKDAE